MRMVYYFAHQQILKNSGQLHNSNIIFPVEAFPTLVACNSNPYNDAVKMGGAPPVT